MKTKTYPIKAFIPLVLDNSFVRENPFVVDEKTIELYSDLLGVPVDFDFIVNNVCSNADITGSFLSDNSRKYFLMFMNPKFVDKLNDSMRHLVRFLDMSELGVKKSGLFNDFISYLEMSDEFENEYEIFIPDDEKRLEIFRQMTFL